MTRDAVPAFSLREAAPEDIDELARLHVAIWRETYCKLAPAEAFAALDVQRRKAFWQDKFDHPAVGQGIFLAEVNGNWPVFALPRRHLTLILARWPKSNSCMFPAILNVRASVNG